MPIVEASIGHVSGATHERSDLDRLWRAVRTRKADAVLVWKFDRFARSTERLILATEEFQHQGGRRIRG